MSPDFKLGSLIGDMLAKANPVLDNIVNFEFKIPEGGRLEQYMRLIFFQEFLMNGRLQ